MTLMNTRAGEDFYEDDEPIGKIVETFEFGTKFKTQRPERGVTRYFDPIQRIAGAHLELPGSGNQGYGYVQARPC